MSVSAKVCIDTISGERWQAIELPPPYGNLLSHIAYKAVVNTLTQRAVDDLIKLYGTRVIGQPYVTIRSTGDVWELDKDEIII